MGVARRTLGGLCALLALAAAAAPHPAGAADARDAVAGPLRLHVGATGRLVFTDRGGDPVLGEASGSLADQIGRVGYLADGRWYHATRVLSTTVTRKGGILLLATDDPSRSLLQVVVATRPEGMIDVRALVTGEPSAPPTATGIAFQARGGERYLGFGERSNAVDQTGNDVRNYVSEGPYQDAERPAIEALVPKPGQNFRPDATYYPVPWLLSTRGYGVLIRNDTTSTFHLRSQDPGVWSMENEGAQLHFSVFAGPRPADALRRMTAATGRQPAPEAPFFFGPWFQPSGSAADSIAKLRAADAPASVGQTYTHYLPCGDDLRDKAAQTEQTALFHDAGLAVTTYLNPMVCTSYQPFYDQVKGLGAFTRHADGTPYTYDYSGSKVFNVAQIDFSNQFGPVAFGVAAHGAIADGYDGWMEDFGEYTPLDAIDFNGDTGSGPHNRYPKLYHYGGLQATGLAGRPILRFNRSGWTGAAPASQVVWGGDPSTTFGFDGLASAVDNGLSMGLSGISLWGSDIGGFFALASPQTTPELLARWIEFGFASGVMRTQANGFGGAKASRAQIFDPATLPIWRRYAKLRTQLYPYLAAAQRRYLSDGMPMMRSLALVRPGEPRAVRASDEYMFGPELLAAPVVDAGATSRSLYVPRGRWVDLWSSVRWDDGPGTIEPTLPRPVAGGRTIKLDAPLDELPLLVRTGAILPLLSPDVDTLTGYGNAPGLVHLGDRRDRMTLLAWPRGERTTAIGRRERIVSGPSAGGWRMRILGRTARNYTLKAALGTLAEPFRPCAVRLGARTLSQRTWSYDPGTTVVEARFRARRGTITLARTCS